MAGPNRDYARRKFAEAAETLASSDAPLITRIEYAVSSIFPLDERAFGDDDIRAEYKELMALLTSAGDHPEGSIPATLRAMTPDTARTVAEKFVSIALQTAERYPLTPKGR